MMACEMIPGYVITGRPLRFNKIDYSNRKLFFQI